MMRHLVLFVVLASGLFPDLSSKLKQIFGADAVDPAQVMRATAFTGGRQDPASETRTAQRRAAEDAAKAAEDNSKAAAKVSEAEASKTAAEASAAKADEARQETIESATRAKASARSARKDTSTAIKKAVAEAGEAERAATVAEVGDHVKTFTAKQDAEAARQIADINSEAKNAASSAAVATADSVDVEGKSSLGDTSAAGEAMVKDVKNATEIAVARTRAGVSEGHEVAVKSAEERTRTAGERADVASAAASKEIEETTVKTADRADVDVVEASKTSAREARHRVFQKTKKEGVDKIETVGTTEGDLGSERVFNITYQPIAAGDAIATQADEARANGTIQANGAEAARAITFHSVDSIEDTRTLAKSMAVERVRNASEEMLKQFQLEAAAYHDLLRQEALQKAQAAVEDLRIRVGQVVDEKIAAATAEAHALEASTRAAMTRAKMAETEGAEFFRVSKNAVVHTDMLRSHLENLAKQADKWESDMTRSSGSLVNATQKVDERIYDISHDQAELIPGPIAHSAEITNEARGKAAVANATAAGAWKTAEAAAKIASANSKNIPIVEKDVADGETEAGKAQQAAAASGQQAVSNTGLVVIRARSHSSLRRA